MRKKIQQNPIAMARWLETEALLIDECKLYPEYVLPPSNCIYQYQ